MSLLAAVTSCHMDSEDRPWTKNTIVFGPWTAVLKRLSRLSVGHGTGSFSTAVQHELGKINIYVHRTEAQACERRVRIKLMGVVSETELRDQQCKA